MAAANLGQPGFPHDFRLKDPIAIRILWAAIRILSGSRVRKTALTLAQNGYRLRLDKFEGQLFGVQGSTALGNPLTAKTVQC